MREGGFSLIEVLAALLVFSVAIIGLTNAGTQSSRAVGALEEKTLAGIVADNQLVLARADDLKTGVQSGEAEIMARKFTYRLETQTTELAGLYRLVVKVQKEGDQQVITERTAYRQAQS